MNSPIQKYLGNSPVDRIPHLIERFNKPFTPPQIDALKIRKVDGVVRPTSLAYVSLDRQEFSDCLYDLSEIARCIDTESMVKRSVKKHASLCLKEGFQIVGKDPGTVEYIKMRLLEIELGTGIAFKQTVREIFDNIVAYSNTFLTYRRDAEKSSGSPINKAGEKVEPIAGIFAIDPTSLGIKRNRWGEVKGYKQCIEGSAYNQRLEKMYDPLDVLHIFYDKKTGFAWGTPFVVSVLDDIRLLRHIEEMANMVVHKGTFPMIHWKVGSDKFPALTFSDTRSEITDVEQEIQDRDSEGVFVTTWRHEIDVIDIKPQDITGYLDYFRNRVMSGLNMSTVDLGEGGTASKASAITMTKSMQSQCKDFQEAVSSGIQVLFDDLVEEGGFLVNEETRVSLVFPEIDIETQQLVQNHAMALYQGHALTEDEMRVAMGREPLPDSEREKMFYAIIEEPRMKEAAKAKAASLGASTSGPAKTTASKNRPSNQSGTKGAAGSRRNDQALIEHRLGRLFDAVLKTLSAGIPERSIADSLFKLVTEALEDSQVDTDRIRQACDFIDAVRPDTIESTLSFVHKNILEIVNGNSKN